jgi:hypothetical protein
VRRHIAKGIGHGAPADVAGEGGLFRIVGVTVFGLKRFESPDGRKIVAGFFMQAALSDAVGVGYAEVAGRLLFGFRLESADDGWQASVGRNAHSRVAISQAV